MFYTVLLIGIGISAIPGGFAIDLVRDRTTRMKHLLRVAGVQPLTYWTAYLLMNSGIFSFSVAAAVILSLITNVGPLIGPALPAFIIVSVLYIPVTIMFSFNISFLFQDADAVQSFWPPLNNFLSFIPYIVTATVDGTTGPHVARVLHYLFCAFIPGYTYLGALYYMFRLSLASSVELASQALTVADYFKPENVVLPTILIMVGHLVLQAALLWVIENWPTVSARWQHARSDENCKFIAQASYMLHVWLSVLCSPSASRRGRRCRSSTCRRERFIH